MCIKSAFLNIQRCKNFNISIFKNLVNMKINKEYNVMETHTAIVDKLIIDNLDIKQKLQNIEIDINNLNDELLQNKFQNNLPIVPTFYDLRKNYINFITSRNNVYIFNDFSEKSKLRLNTGIYYLILDNKISPITFYSEKKNDCFQLKGLHTVQKDDETYFYNKFQLIIKKTFDPITLKSYDGKIVMKDFFVFKKRQIPIQYEMSIQYKPNNFNLGTILSNTYERTKYEKQIKIQLYSRIFNIRGININLLNISEKNGIKFSIDINSNNKYSVDTSISKAQNQNIDIDIDIIDMDSHTIQINSLKIDKIKYTYI